MTTVSINDVPRSIAADTIAALAALLALPSAGVALALNGELVRRVEWAERRLADGDRVDVLGAAQGG